MKTRAALYFFAWLMWTTLFFLLMHTIDSREKAKAALDGGSDVKTFELQPKADSVEQMLLLFSQYAEQPAISPLPQAVSNVVFEAQHPDATPTEGGKP